MTFAEAEDNISQIRGQQNQALQKGSHLLLNRRQALISIGLAALHGAAWSLSKPLRPTLPVTTNASFDTPEPSSDETVDDRLRADLERLAPRAYSEEGIPVFLACVNLVPADTLQPLSKVTLSPLSAALASTFHRNAQAYQRIRPAAKAKDVAPLIEVLADRDFSKGETTERS